MEKERHFLEPHHDSTYVQKYRSVHENTDHGRRAALILRASHWELSEEEKMRREVMMLQGRRGEKGFSFSLHFTSLINL